MKHRLRYSLLLLLSMFFSLSSQAQTLIDGIYYNLDTETNTASVTRNSNWGGYSGEIIIPSSVESEGIVYSVTSIGDYAFRGCTSLTSVEIPSSVTRIGDWAFEGCTSLTSVEISSSVTSIGDYAFRDCTSLTSVEIPSSVTSIGDYAFRGCTSLTSVEIPSSVTSIGDWAFCGCTSLTSVEIPSSVTSIGDGAFESCTSLTSVEIPSSVTSIGFYAFKYCTSLTFVVCEAVAPPTCSAIYTFDRVSLESATLYVPEASVGAYSTTYPWRAFGRILTLSDFDTKIDAVEENAGRGASAHAVYSLSGQRTVLPGSGIYITNGKVFIAK